VEEEECKQRALLRSAKVERTVPVPRLERPEDAEFQLLLAFDALKVTPSVSPGIAALLPERLPACRHISGSVRRFETRQTILLVMTGHM
jgi:hypothetical protein